MKYNPVSLWKQIKKTDKINNLDKLSTAEMRRYEEIIAIQKLLTDGFAPVQIKDMLHISYNTIRRYAKGDPLNMCRFNRESVLDKYQPEIIEFLHQNMPRREILERLSSMGYAGKMTALKVYSKKLIEQLQIQYTPHKNSTGVPVNSKKKSDLHYVSRQDLLKYLWSGKSLPKEDIEYLWGKFPVLSELEFCIAHFRNIYTEKNLKILDWFIAIYKTCSLKTIVSFANGLLLDIDAVCNSVISPLSNGFVEGINNKIKLIKRVMYGRAKMPLLSAKIIQQPRHD